VFAPGTSAAAADQIVRRSLSIGGRRVSYLWRDGDAPTLVFIHGSGVSARYWSNQVRGAAGTARVVALDLPGHGESEDATAPSLVAYAEAAARLIDALRAWPVIAIGHSLGAAVAMTLAAGRPADVHGLVLLSGCARLPPVSVSAQWIWGSLPSSVRRVLFFLSAKNLLFAAGASPAAVALGMQELRACRPPTLAADVAMARSMDLTRAAGALRVPTLILCGSRDRVTPPALSRHLHATIAGAHLEIVEGAGHMLLIEAPAIVNRAIAAFASAIAHQPPPPGAIRLAARASVSRCWRALRRLLTSIRSR
jgi:pimeloyl-ACP methyl ester carboxylesterase